MQRAAGSSMVMEVPVPMVLAMSKRPAVDMDQLDGERQVRGRRGRGFEARDLDTKAVEARDFDASDLDIRAPSGWNAASPPRSPARAMPTPVSQTL